MIQNRTAQLAKKIFEHGDIKGGNPDAPFCATFLLSSSDDSTIDLDISLNSDDAVVLNWVFKKHFLKLESTSTFTDNINQRVTRADAELMYLTSSKILSCEEFLVDETYFEFISIISKINKFILACKQSNVNNRSHSFPLH